MEQQEQQEDLQYQKFGNGEAVFLIHGFGETGEVFYQLAQDLSEKYTVYVPSLPGISGSDLVENLSIESMAAGILKIADAEEINKAFFLGHSMGGYIALALLESDPARFLGIGLLHSTPLADDEEKKENRTKTAAIIEERGSANFLAGFIPKLFAEKNHIRLQEEIEVLKGMYTAIPTETLVAQTLAMRNRPDRSEILNQADCMVLAILGKDDALIPLTKTLSAIHNTKTIQICILDGVGHMGFIESYEKFYKEISEFLLNALILHKN